jgi:perosamine synthetase
MYRSLLRRTFVGVGSALALRAAQGRSAADRPALLGGDPVRSGGRSTPWPQGSPEDEKSWLEVLRSGRWWRREGQHVRNFEKAWAERLDARYAIATANGTSALMAALHAVDVGPKDEVLVGPYTFIATINSILAHYALPVFVDTDPETMMIDAAKVEAAITPRTRCILPVHLGGNMADMDRLLAISKKRNVAVVEDACQAHLSEWRKKKAATVGDLGCFSFHKLKNLAGGEAGAVMTNDERLYRRAYGFHSHYRTPDENAPDPAVCQNGINLRMSEFQGAVLMRGLTRLEEQAQTRDRNAAYLGKLLAEAPGVKPVKMYEGCTRNAWHIYMMKYDPEAFQGLTRDQFLKAARAEGVGFSGGYGPLNKEPFLENTLNSRAFRAIYTKQEIGRWRERNRCPANDRACQEALWFGQAVMLGARGDMEDIAMAVRKIQRHAEALKKA